MFTINLATKANTRKENTNLKASLRKRFEDLPDLSVFESGQIRLGSNFFVNSGISGNKSVSYGLGEDGKVYFVTVEGNDGTSYRSTEKGKKGRLNTSSEFLKIVKEAGLFPEDAKKVNFNLKLTEIQMEGVLEVYELVTYVKPVKSETDVQDAGHEDEDEDAIEYEEEGDELKVLVSNDTPDSEVF